MTDDIFKKFGLHRSALEEASKALGQQQSVFEEQARLSRQLGSSASFIEDALSARSAAEEILSVTGVRCP